MVDEAHATGVLGRSGAGLADALGLGATHSRADGTLGKALGSAGRICRGARDRSSSLLINPEHGASSSRRGSRPRPSAGAGAALDVVTAECRAASRRSPRTRHVPAATVLRSARVRGRRRRTHILPVVLGDKRAHGRVFGGALRRRGVLVHPIRPPTVPWARRAFASRRSPPTPRAQLDRRARRVRAPPGANAVARDDRSIDARRVGPRQRMASVHPDADWLARWSRWSVVEGQGCVAHRRATAVDYLDGVSSLWCNVHGHRHPSSSTPH
jgi:hypothetical protein